MLSVFYIKYIQLTPDCPYITGTCGRHLGLINDVEFEVQEYYIITLEDSFQLSQIPMNKHNASAYPRSMDRETKRVTYRNLKFAAYIKFATYRNIHKIHKMRSNLL